MKLEALKALAAKVEAGSTSWSGACIKAAFRGHYQSLFYEAFHGSLDAAKALHNVVLPDEGWNIQWTMKYPHLMGDGNPFVARIGWGEIFAASGPNPARAWLLAILRALIAQEESDG